MKEQIDYEELRQWTERQFEEDWGPRKDLRQSIEFDAQFAGPELARAIDAHTHARMKSNRTVTKVIKQVLGRENGS